MAGDVPFVALGRQHEAIQEELHAVFDRVLGASGFILGEEVERFEHEFAAYCEVDHCVGVASGTAALMVMLLGAGIGPGDEVIVPAHTFIASALGVAHAGATPVFCDVHEDTGLLDAGAASEAVTERTAAVLAVHLYGQTCDMDAIGDFARRHGLAVFEDAAQAHGATWRGRRTGALGTAAAFSFYPSKNLGALGDGGAICTNDGAIADEARSLRHLGQRGKGHHERLGYNERLDGLQAGFLRVKLRHLDTWNAARRRHAAAYCEALQGQVELLEEHQEGVCVYHLYPVRLPDRDGAAAKLASAGIHTGVHYSPAVPDQPPFATDSPVSGFPRARRWASEELSLPMFEHLTDQELIRVAEALTAVIDRQRVPD